MMGKKSHDGTSVDSGEERRSVLNMDPMDKGVCDGGMIACLEEALAKVSNSCASERNSKQLSTYDGVNLFNHEIVKGIISESFLKQNQNGLSQE